MHCTIIDIIWNNSFCNRENYTKYIDMRFILTIMIMGFTVGSIYAQVNPPVIVDTFDNEMNVNPANPKNYPKDTVVREPVPSTPAPVPSIEPAPKTAPGSPDTTPGVPPSPIPRSPNTVPNTSPGASPNPPGLPKSR